MWDHTRNRWLLPQTEPQGETGSSEKCGALSAMYVLGFLTMMITFVVSIPILIWIRKRTSNDP